MRIKLRNPIIRAPIMRKGGAHIKAKSGKRAKAKKEINKAVNEWTTDKRQF